MVCCPSFWEITGKLLRPFSKKWTAIITTKQQPLLRSAVSSEHGTVCLCIFSKLGVGKESGIMHLVQSEMALSKEVTRIPCHWKQVSDSKCDLSTGADTSIFEVRWLSSFLSTEYKHKRQSIKSAHNLRLAWLSHIIKECDEQKPSQIVSWNYSCDSRL